MNLPSWFDSHVSVLHHKNNERELNRRTASRSRPAVTSPDELRRCFDDPSLFVCHPYGLRNQTTRRVLFRSVLRARRAATHAWMHASGERVIHAGEFERLADASS